MKLVAKFRELAANFRKCTQQPLELRVEQSKNDWRCAQSKLYHMTCEIIKLESAPCISEHNYQHLIELLVNDFRSLQVIESRVKQEMYMLYRNESAYIQFALGYVHWLETVHPDYRQVIAKCNGLIKAYGDVK